MSYFIMRVENTPLFLLLLKWNCLLDIWCCELFITELSASIFHFYPFLFMLSCLVESVISCATIITNSMPIFHFGNSKLYMEIDMNV